MLKVTQFLTLQLTLHLANRSFLSSKEASVMIEYNVWIDLFYSHFVAHVYDPIKIDGGKLPAN